MCLLCSTAVDVSGFGSQGDPTTLKQKPPTRNLTNRPKNVHLKLQLLSPLVFGNSEMGKVSIITSLPIFWAILLFGSFKNSCAETKFMVYPRSHHKRLKNAESILRRSLQYIYAGCWSRQGCHLTCIFTSSHKCFSLYKNNLSNFILSKRLFIRLWLMV